MLSQKEEIKRHTLSMKNSQNKILQSLKTLFNSLQDLYHWGSQKSKQVSTEVTPGTHDMEQKRTSGKLCHCLEGHLWLALLKETVTNKMMLENL